MVGRGGGLNDRAQADALGRIARQRLGRWLGLRLGRGVKDCDGGIPDGDTSLSEVISECGDPDLPSPLSQSRPGVAAMSHLGPTCTSKAAVLTPIRWRANEVLLEARPGSATAIDEGTGREMSEQVGENEGERPAPPPPSGQPPAGGTAPTGPPEPTADPAGHTEASPVDGGEASLQGGDRSSSTIAVIAVVATLAVVAQVAGRAYLATKATGNELSGSVTVLGSDCLGRSAGGSCDPSGGYGDIDSGSQVTVTDGSGKTSAVGTLGAGTYIDAFADLDASTTTSR